MNVGLEGGERASVARELPRAARERVKHRFAVYALEHNAVVDSLEWTGHRHRPRRRDLCAAHPLVVGRESVSEALAHAPVAVVDHEGGAAGADNRLVPRVHLGHASGVTRTACPLDCPDTCTLEVTVEAGRITAIDAGPGNPLTDGYICQKVKHHARRVYGPDRVLVPLLRTGPKGTGTFAPIAWDEALDLFVDRLRTAAAGKHGPASVVPYLYNSSAGDLALAALGPRLWRRFGATDVLPTICAATAGAAYDAVYGDMLSADPFDVVHARCVVVWGANPTVANIHFPPLVQQARDAGARLIVVTTKRESSRASNIEICSWS